MPSDKRGGKGFCPFCGSEFEGDRDICPNCGQDIRQYNDDLGPVLDRIQTATNIDMKSTKVRVTMSIIIFILVFGGALLVFQHFDSKDDPEPPYIPEGIIVDVVTNGYMDLSGDFASGTLKALPLYEPSLRLQISLSSELEGKYSTVMWMVETEYYNRDNPKNEYYVKVTKDSSSPTPVETVTWEGLRVGIFTVTAECTTSDNVKDVYQGYGSYYGRYDTVYNWTYMDSNVSLEYSMSQDGVTECINTDLSKRLMLQEISEVKDFVVVSEALSGLNDALKHVYSSKRPDYSDEGYADFVLSFVQQCFGKTPDSYNYKVPDYWALPDETILWGAGDDTDISVLYCSLMKAAGIGSALFNLQDTTIAAALVDPNSTFIADPTIIKGSGNTYVVADTDSMLQLGDIRPIYIISDDGTKVYYNGKQIDYSLVSV